MIETTRLAECMQFAVASTFESMSFCEVVPHPEPNPLERLTGIPVLHGQVELKTPLQGRLNLLCPADLIVEAHDDLYGECPLSPDAQGCRDLIGELTNMIAGQFLSEIAGSGRPSDLGLPEFSTEIPPGFDTLQLFYFLRDDGFTIVTGLDLPETEANRNAI